MGLVGFALRFRHTFYVLALMMLFLGGSAILTTPKDIFPNINIPVVTVIWQYTGLTPEEMEQRVTTYSEYSISSNVNDIRNIESQTLSGMAVERIYFQPNVNIDLAISQIVSASNAIRALMPAGIQPPVIGPRCCPGCWRFSAAVRKPMPGIVASRRLVSFVLCQALIFRSSASTSPVSDCIWRTRDCNAPRANAGM